MTKKEMLTDAFLDVLSSHTAGDPMDGTVRWTHLHSREICQLILEKHQVKTSNTVVKKLLNQHQFRRRKAQKKVTMGSNVNRDAQFRKIAELRTQYAADGNLIVSVDTKKYETGRKVPQAFRENMPIIFDAYLPKWNYRAVPQLPDGTVI